MGYPKLWICVKKSFLELMVSKLSFEGWIGDRWKRQRTGFLGRGTNLQGRAWHTQPSAWLAERVRNEAARKMKRHTGADWESFMFHEKQLGLCPEGHREPLTTFFFSYWFFFFSWFIKMRNSRHMVMCTKSKVRVTNHPGFPQTRL